MYVRRNEIFLPVSRKKTRKNTLVVLLLLQSRVARFFLVQCTKTGENMPKDPKITKWPYNIPYGCKIFQMDII
jgi:hypothetical protein